MFLINFAFGEIIYMMILSYIYTKVNKLNSRIGQIPFFSSILFNTIFGLFPLAIYKKVCYYNCAGVFLWGISAYITERKARSLL